MIVGICILVMISRHQKLHSPYTITSPVKLTCEPEAAAAENVATDSDIRCSPELVAKLSNASAALWCMGSPSAGRDVTVDYSLAAADMCAERLTPQPGKGFTFIFLSGALVEKGQKKSLDLCLKQERCAGSRS